MQLIRVDIFIWQGRILFAGHVLRLFDERPAKASKRQKTWRVTTELPRVQFDPKTFRVSGFNLTATSR